ncbi:hypothetical protein BDQ17DRAFT_1433782 [Cyathus striatus]|nr:hypothetical protein BDQ17DRAFT_1433782 [Cyathus striatus]
MFSSLPFSPPSLLNNESGLINELILQVRKVIGPFAAAKKIFIIGDLPKSRSGKVQREVRSPGGQFDPTLHSFTGINCVSLAGFSHVTDPRVIEATKQLSSEFPFNLDMNSGNHIGIGWAPSTIGNGTTSSFCHVVPVP